MTSSVMSFSLHASKLIFQCSSEVSWRLALKFDKEGAYLGDLLIYNIEIENKATIYHYDDVFMTYSASLLHIKWHGRQPQISLFWPRFGSGFKCIVTNRKSAFLLTLTYYFEATEIPAGISSYFSESLFITAPF